MKKSFEKILRKSQVELKKYVERRLEETHKGKITVADGFVYAQGTFPVLLIAHLDTVHKILPYFILTSKDKNGNKTLSSPSGIGGDDRCGVYMIFEVLKKFNCSVLFCEDEEIGCIGATKFTEHSISDELQFNYIIEFDRKGSNDAVFYDCDNPEFEEFITKEFFELNWGSMSDISVVAPYLGCAAVNLSCGYYNAHTKDEYVVVEEMEKVIEEACKLLARTTEKDVFEYIEAVRNYGYKYSSKWWDSCFSDASYYSKGCYSSYDLYDGYEEEQEVSYVSTKYTIEEKYFLISFCDVYGVQNECIVYAHSDVEAVGQFLTDHPGMCYGDIIEVIADDYMI